MTNALRQKLEQGPVYGGWCSIGSPFTAELLRDAGYDYVCVDLQHGLTSDLLPMLQALRGTSPVVRVYNVDGIGKALDTGAEVVIVPMVNTREEAGQAVSACKYAPDGTRSYGPTRASDADPMLFVMIETAAGLVNVDEICSTPGVDGVYIGPADLARSLGTDIADAVERIKAATLAAGKFAGIHTQGGAQARERVEQGFQMVTCGTDAGLMRATFAEELKRARG